MSTTNDLIEITNLSYLKLRTLLNKEPIKHLREVPFGNFDLDLCLCDETYQLAEEAGHLRCYAAFVDAKYAGYLIVMASEMIHHHRVMQAVTDSFYIAPAYRSTGAFTKLLEYVEADLKENNIRFFTVGLNVNMPHYSKMENMLNKIGYINTELAVTKEL